MFRIAAFILGFTLATLALLFTMAVWATGVRFDVKEVS